MQAEQNDLHTPKTNLLDPHQWVSRYADYLYSYALGRLNDEELCRDLVQETFLAALEKAGQFKGLSTERTWLTAILKHKVIDVYRKKSAQMAWKPDSAQAEKQQEDFFDPNDGHWNPPHPATGFWYRTARPAYHQRVCPHSAALYEKTTRALAFCFYHEAHG
jgi:RNA polymerase sigma-70 factor (ECF subfamily)